MNKKLICALLLYSSVLYCKELTPQIVEAIKNDNKTLLAENINNKDDANAKNQNGKTVLMLAIWEGRYEIVKILISRGADVNAVDKDGKSALMLAVWKENQELIEFLIANGADINKANNDGIKAIDLAHLTGNGDIIDYFEKSEKTKEQK